MSSRLSGPSETSTRIAFCLARASRAWAYQRAASPWAGGDELTKEYSHTYDPFVSLMLAAAALVLAPRRERIVVAAVGEGWAERFAELDEVPVPPNWGGYLIASEVVEFWQGRENRVHNRIRITADAELPVTMHNNRIERLQP